MAAQVMDGRALAAAMLERIRTGVSDFAAEFGRRPLLATVLVGDDPASHTYVRMKANRCGSVGMTSLRIEVPAEASTQTVVARIGELSEDSQIDGILLQHPVPPHVDERAASEAITPSKDVDGVTRSSFAAMAFGEPGFSSATPGGIMSLLDAYEVDLAGKHAVVVGRSPILGKPVGMLLLQRDATVTYCHFRMRDLATVVSTGDVVMAAVGRPALIRGEWIKPGAVVVDAGCNAGNIGDVEYEVAYEAASLIAPVPGGRGPDDDRHPAGPDHAGGPLAPRAPRPRIDMRQPPVVPIGSPLRMPSGRLRQKRDRPATVQAPAEDRGGDRLVVQAPGAATAGRPATARPCGR